MISGHGAAADVFSRLTTLRKDRTPFVLATVVASYPPQSVRAGAKAIILADGTIEGWIGGGCIRPVVLEEAREALAAATPRLVRMNAGATRADGAKGVHDYPMTCQGEGGVEIYLEPILPAPRLVVLGDTPVAHMLARLAAEIGYQLSDAPSSADAVVVATMGVGDEEALERAARSDASYVGLVASRKKASFLFDYLRANGVPDDQLAKVKAPAGLDLGGMTPGEIALSILAEIVQRNCHRKEGSTSATTDMLVDRATADRSVALPADDTRAMDPICGMSVEKATSRHTLEIGGETYYFCCPHCKARFAKAHA